MLSTTIPECPPGLLARARELPPIRTAVVNAGTPLVMTSARMATDEGLIEPVLVGDASDIRRVARDIGWDISEIRLVHVAGEANAAACSVSLARHGEVGALMKGHLHTDDLMRAVLNRDEGLRAERRISHVFHMTVPGNDSPLCITDAVINILPSVSEKIDIARNAASLLHALGNSNPKIALLSGSESPSPKMPSSIEAREIAQLAAEGGVEGAEVDGPLSFDIAVSVEAARIKDASGNVAGNADILLVPNVEAGNFMFKQMVYFQGATAAGLVLGGLVPIMLTSRADPPVARMASAALAAICAAHFALQKPSGSPAN